MRDISKEELNIILDNSRNGEYANLSSADLRSADLSFADLRSADLRYANLSSADLSFADLSSADLSSANLRYADLSSANLRSANLSYADLRSADLSSADLSFADLRSADLRYADLRSANLSSTDLSESCLTNCVGNMIEVKTILLDTYPITYTAEVLQIGCERHDIGDWWKFSDEDIQNMDGDKALEWWGKYKTFIKRAIKLSPAVRSKLESKEIK